MKDAGPSPEHLLSPDQLPLTGLGAPQILEIQTHPLSPSDDVRLTERGEKFDTPVDDRGIVDSDALIALVKSTVESGYDWRGYPDVHHLHWESSWYHDHTLFTYEHGRLFRRFVELPVHKLLVPREFHDHLHVVTKPVEPPSVEHMEQRVKGWSIAERLFKSAGGLDDTVVLAESRFAQIQQRPETLRDDYGGLDYAGIEWYVTELRRHFGALEMRIDELRRLPPEFQFVAPEHVEAVLDTGKPSDIDPELVAELHENVRWIGSVASRNSVNGMSRVREQPSGLLIAS